MKTVKGNVTVYDKTQESLLKKPRRWLVTGAAGFIGSNLVEGLLKLDQDVVGLDNFATGHRANLENIQKLVSKPQWGRFHFEEADICHPEACAKACRGVEIILHQAALGSVPRSIKDPKRSHDTNVNGFLNMLIAARDSHVQRFVYASSSSVYGDNPDLPKLEGVIGRQLSPYAVTKRANELYADVFAQHYGLQVLGLRYFNVFGPRQYPEGPYAAVIPRWIQALIDEKPIEIFGDGETSRDFCYVENAVQANILAGTTENPEAFNQVYNVAVGQTTSLKAIFELIRGEVAKVHPSRQAVNAQFKDFRAGDIRHSLANIEKAQRLIGYLPLVTVKKGLEMVVPRYLRR